MKRTRSDVTLAIIRFASIAVLFIALSSVAAAQTPATQSEAKENVQTGTIASTGTYGQATSVDVQTDGASPGDEANVIGASLERLSRSSCEVTLKNASEKNSYTATWEVVGLDESGRRQLFKSYTASISPKGSVTRSFGCGDYNLQVNLKSAKKTGR